MAFHSFENLEVWRQACDLAVFTFETLRGCREFALCDQMQRAAVSVVSNIAEGAERSPKDFLRFLSFARGSASELRTQAYIAGRLQMAESASLDHIVDETKHINRMLTGLSQAIRKKLNPEL